MKRALDFCERDNWTGDMSVPTGQSTESAVDEPKTSHKVLSVSSFSSISSILLFKIPFPLSADERPNRRLTAREQS